jgi:predicted alpha-1,6-mannanase (GH76 family)
MHARHLRRLWRLPGTLLGVVAWPAGPRQRLSLGLWHYWWQAHLLDCSLDAYLRDPSPARRATVERLARGVRLRNLRRGWVNDFYDDIAWLGLALHRASHVGIRHDGALAAIRERLHEGWSNGGGGGIWWCVGSDFKNAPANGPAAILLARSATGRDFDLALRIAEWIERHLVDPDSGLVWDGVRVDPAGGVRAVERAVYTYCQGVYLGICVELALARELGVWTRRAHRTIAAINAAMTDCDGVLRTHGGGDGGLFTGILARYLALAALLLPGESQPDRIARQTAADLVLTSATAAWRNRAVVTGGPLFGHDWSVPARPPYAGSAEGDVAERDLSVQLSGWMLCEAAALVERRRPELL